MNQHVLSAYGFKAAETSIQPFGKGLINRTWKIVSAGNEYILQQVNDTVFKQPGDIAANSKLLKNHLAQYHPGYNFISPIAAVNGDELVFIERAFFRLFPFVKGSHSKDVVMTPGQAYEAALQFGRLTHLLSAMDSQKLKITIPGFHDLSLRYRQFMDAMKNGNKERIAQSKELIEALEAGHDIVKTYEKIKSDPAFRLRVTHHDTKISNVLFDKEDKGLCVIDLDTVMPGYFFSDLGDMMRTYLSPSNEEEKEYDKIEVRDEFYKAIVQGYSDEMKDELSATERKHFFYAGRFMIYMQALRFLTDHINNDIYYGAAYRGQNLIRAGNQLTLLRRLSGKEKELIKI